jgi:hypothetical protein
MKALSVGFRALDASQVVPAQFDAGGLAVGEELGEVLEGGVRHLFGNGE